jgi:hypothetical protein
MQELLDRLAKIRDGKFSEIVLGSSRNRGYVQLERDER